MKRIAFGLALGLLILGSGCAPAPPRRVAVIGDSMLYGHQQVIADRLTQAGHTVLTVDSAPGTTTWTHPTLPAWLARTDVDVYVLTDGLNVVASVRGDPGFQQVSMQAALDSWDTVLAQAHAHGATVVWCLTQTATPLHTWPTAGIIATLNDHTRANAVPCEWGPRVDAKINAGDSSWVIPDGFHPSAVGGAELANAITEAVR